MVHDKHYYSILLLVKISSIVLSPVVSRDIIPYLEILTEEKLTQFKELYPSSTIIPKMHYMVHYGSQLRKFGPLVNTWTMRHEAKLSFVKRSSQRSNFKNVPKSVAKAHQFWLCHMLESCDNVVKVDYEFGKKVETVISCESIELRNAFELACTVTDNTIVTHHKWLRVQNNVYKIGKIVLTTYDNFKPQFGKILDIVASDQTIIFHIDLYYTKHFDEHFVI